MHILSRMAESVQQATLRRAFDLAGGSFSLARKLGISATSLMSMLAGEEQIPPWVFLRAADYINEEQERPYQQPNVVILHDRRRTERTCVRTDAE